MRDIYLNIENLLNYGLHNDFFGKMDKGLVRNQILDLLRVSDFEEVDDDEKEVDQDGHGTQWNFYQALEVMTDFAVERRLIEDNLLYQREGFQSKLMGLMMPRQSEINRIFSEKYKVSPKGATDYFYNLSKRSNYIMMKRIEKNLNWNKRSEYGDMAITINLSKPEKDPKEIEMARHLSQSSYPKCLLCAENVGYAGRVNHPSRHNHRIIQVTLGDEPWYLQYSPYVYYNEHCIVLSEKHEPMKIDRSTFEKLFDFVDQFNHYFIGSNADIPIVGGSILSHEHFQGGNYEFPMMKAKAMVTFAHPKFEGLKVSQLEWPVTVIKLEGDDREQLVDLGSLLLERWRSYSDPESNILSRTDAPHNSITPVVRRSADNYEMYLALRNNRCTEAYPHGIFHPHEELHNIKKENIGLIEVMGMAILPKRLKEEMETIESILLRCEDMASVYAEMQKLEDLQKHITWMKGFEDQIKTLKEEAPVQGDYLAILNEEMGETFVEVLKCAGVFLGNDEGLSRFMKSVGFECNGDRA